MVPGSVLLRSPVVPVPGHCGFSSRAGQTPPLPPFPRKRSEAVLSHLCSLARFRFIGFATLSADCDFIMWFSLVLDLSDGVLFTFLLQSPCTQSRLTKYQKRAPQSNCQARRLSLSCGSLWPYPRVQCLNVSEPWAEKDPRSTRPALASLLSRLCGSRLEFVKFNSHNPAPTSSEREVMGWFLVSS